MTTTRGHIYIDCRICGEPDVELPYTIHGGRYAALGLDVELTDPEPCTECGFVLDTGSLEHDEWERLADEAVEDAR